MERMKEWQSELDISDLHKDYQNGDMTVRHLGVMVGERIRKNKFFVDDGELEDLAEEFENNVDDIEDYDYHLKDLYDFADFDKRIWINTDAFGFR